MSPFRRRRQPDPDPAEDQPLEEVPFPETVFDVQQAQKADHDDQWQGSWERLSDKVFAFLRRRYGHRSLPPGVELDDLFSGVLARMLRDLPRLQVHGRDAFWGWVTRVAANQITDDWRRQKRKRRGGHLIEAEPHDEDSDSPLDAAPDAGAATPSAIARAHELEQAERECVEGLPSARARRIYEFRRLWELPYSEIAERVGDSNPSLTRATFHRAKEKVLECLRNRLDGYTEFAREL